MLVATVLVRPLIDKTRKRCQNKMLKCHHPMFYSGSSWLGDPSVEKVSQ